MALKGQKAHSDRLKRLSGKQVVKMAKGVLEVGAQRIRGTASVSITTGAQSGKNHKPSRPGTPPNEESGGLRAGIKTRDAGPLMVEVISDARYAAIHEFGGTIQHPGGTPYFIRDGKAVFVSKGGYGAFHTLPLTKPHAIVMPKRPYMKPARDKEKPFIEKLFAEKLGDLIARSKS